MYLMKFSSYDEFKSSVKVNTNCLKTMILINFDIVIRLHKKFDSILQSKATLMLLCGGVE